MKYRENIAHNITFVNMFLMFFDKNRELMENSQATLERKFVIAGYIFSQCAKTI